MKVSLITVCYNSAATIRDAIESALSQKDVELEYLVIDGGSTDGTVEIIKEYSNKLRWISERDAGMYDAMNKGIKMSSGEIIGILNADDVLASDSVLAKISAAFEADNTIDGTYADIRFVRELSGRTVRYCTGRFFRPWMFRFGVQTAHPATFFRRTCFERWGNYSLDFGMFGDFELLCRFIWKYHAKMRYLPFCTTVMRLGGASTSGWRSTKAINEADIRALKTNGCWTATWMLYLRYPFKIWGYVFKRA